MPHGSTSMQQDLSPLLPKPWAFTPQPSGFGWVDGLASLFFSWKTSDSGHRPLPSSRGQLEKEATTSQHRGCGQEGGLAIFNTAGSLHIEIKH